MSSSAVKCAAPAATAAGARQRISLELVLRIMAAAAAVVVCYQFQWLWLRHWTMVCNAALDRVFGVVLVPMSADTVMWHGATYRYVIACTMADVWCGALAFLWMIRRNIAENVLTLAGFTVGLFALNIARLSLSDFLCAHGASWNLGHNVVAGICYFLIWEWLLWHRRRYSAF